ncbi:MAG TPA: polyphosphate kinase 2 [Phenylobacterium sp.]|nr:polyphosphate kinase 2 [Phenylobacterium sp.]
MGKRKDAKKAYEAELEKLQIALVRTQQHTVETGEKDLVIFEGRDAAGKDGTIERIVEHLSIRNTRVVALPKPSDRQRSEWYFQRYTAHLPAAGELVLFNRSWYNRAGVERVMGFSTAAEQEVFLRDVPAFESMLLDSGMTLTKLWLDISKEEQAERLEARRTDPLKALKISPLDAVAQERWSAYTAARDEMLKRTHTPEAPWVCVRADDKKTARLNVIRHLLHRIAPKALLEGIDKPDPAILFPFEPAALTDGRLHR